MYNEIEMQVSGREGTNEGGKRKILAGAGVEISMGTGTTGAKHERALRFKSRVWSISRGGDMGPGQMNNMGVGRGVVGAEWTTGSDDPF